MFMPIVSNYVASAAAAISFGRANKGGASGAGSDYTIGWASGGAAASGRILVAVVVDNVGIGGVISGGSAWTAATGNVVGSRCFYKVCGGSEPTTYTVSYSGSAKSDASNVAILEVIGASAIDAVASNSSTATAPSATSSAASDAGIVVSTESNTPPSGYTNYGGAGAPSIGGKLLVGSGSISPGNWSGSNTVNWTILCKI